MRFLLAAFGLFWLSVLPCFADSLELDIQTDLPELQDSLQASPLPLTAEDRSAGGG